MRSVRNRPITKRMKDAGIDVLLSYEYGCGDTEAVVAAIYAAMVAARETEELTEAAH